MRNRFHNLKDRQCLLMMGLLVLILASCTGRQKPLNETPTRGDIVISVDESFQPLIDAEINAFTGLYRNATITPVYKPEYDVLIDFLRDCVQVAVTSTLLTDDQVAYLLDQQIIVKSVAVAHDALALIVNRRNPDSLLTYENVRDIFLGKITRWNQVNPSSRLGDIKVVFDNTKSGNVRYFKEKFEIDTILPANFYALNNNEEVINYISTAPDGLGIISVNWISDKDDSTSMSFITKIKVVAVSLPFLDDSFSYPLQGSIYERSYPFTRDVYIMSRETFLGLGRGFMQWVAADQGQRIVLKSGLVPATMPVRLIEVKSH